MASIVYQLNKRTGNLYAYHAVSYRDPVTKRPKSKRTYIGPVNPETKEFLHPADAARRLSALEPIKDLNLNVSTELDNTEAERIMNELALIKEELAEIKSRMQSKETALQSMRQALDDYIQA